MQSFATGLARLPGRRIPIKGWTRVTEFLHAHFVQAYGMAIYRNQYGLVMQLDLDDSIQRGMYYDAWEEDELNILTLVLSTGDVMIDVGAYVGLFALVAAKAVAGNGGEVHAFEPVPDNYDRLVRNIALNGLANVTPNRLALGETSGHISLAIDPSMDESSGQHASGCFTAAKIGNPVRQIDAQLEALDSYCARRLRDRPIRLIKIDVEGADPSVLLGMQSILSSRRADFILLEVNQYSLARSGAKMIDTVRPLTEA